MATLLEVQLYMSGKDISLATLEEVFIELRG